MATTKDVSDWIARHTGARVDVDGAYGAQCMDLSVRYALDLWGFRLTGNAENLRNQALPAGWQRIRNSANFVPKLGDIFVWYDNAHPYGHTGIVVSGNLNTYDVLDQNTAGTNGGPGSEAKRHTYTYAHFWGVVRPPITATSAPSAPSAPTGKRVAQSGTFTAGKAVNVRREPKTTGNNPVAVYEKGQSVKYDSYIDSDGWRWVSYVGQSGKRNYIAVRNLSTGSRQGVCK